jgi:hypothetical protein
VDGRKKTDEMGVEVVDISDDLAAAPAVVRRSTVNSDKSAPASKLCLSPIEANVEVTDDNTVADGLMKKTDEQIFTCFYLSTQVGEWPRGLGLIWGQR